MLLKENTTLLRTNPIDIRLGSSPVLENVSASPTCYSRNAFLLFPTSTRSDTALRGWSATLATAGVLPRVVQKNIPELHNTNTTPFPRLDLSGKVLSREVQRIVLPSRFRIHLVCLFVCGFPRCQGGHRCNLDSINLSQLDVSQFTQL